MVPKIRKVTSRNSSYSIIGKTGGVGVPPWKNGTLVPQESTPYYAYYIVAIPWVYVSFKKGSQGEGFLQLEDHHPLTWVSQDPKLGPFHNGGDLLTTYKGG